jgi:multidrug efflux pump
VLAAQFNSFRDPFVILAGSVPLAMFGALIFTFLKMPDPNVPFWTRAGPPPSTSTPRWGW